MKSVHDDSPNHDGREWVDGAYPVLDTRSVTSGSYDPRVHESGVGRTPSFRSRVVPFRIFYSLMMGGGEEGIRGEDLVTTVRSSSLDGRRGVEVISPCLQDGSFSPS